MFLFAIAVWAHADADWVSGGHLVGIHSRGGQGTVELPITEPYEGFAMNYPASYKRAKNTHRKVNMMGQRGKAYEFEIELIRRQNRLLSTIQYMSRDYGVSMDIELPLKLTQEEEAIARRFRAGLGTTGQAEDFMTMIDLKLGNIERSVGARLRLLREKQEQKEADSASDTWLGLGPKKWAVQMRITPKLMSQKMRMRDEHDEFDQQQGNSWGYHAESEGWHEEWDETPQSNNIFRVETEAEEGLYILEHGRFIRIGGLAF